MRNQTSRSAHDRLTLEDQMSIQYWRKELSCRINKFNSLTEMAEALAKLDAEFDGTRGYFQVVSASRGRAGLRVTSKMVLLIDQLFPQSSPDHKLKDRLSRQGLTRRG